MHKTKIISILIIISCSSFSQVIIDQDSAFSIAERNGLEQGIDSATAEFEDRIWTIECILCREGNSYTNQIIKINAETGEVIENSGYCHASMTCGSSPRDKTNINWPNNYDTLTQILTNNKPFRITNLTEGDECNASLSPDNEKIVFQYNSNIYFVSFDNQKEVEICQDCSTPNWYDNNWVTYFKKDESQLFKYNINTGVHLPIVKLPKAYSDDYALTKENEWIAYISNEVWDIPDVKKRLFRKRAPQYRNVLINGRDRDLCLISKETGDKRHITKEARYVHSPTWSLDGNTLYFYIENEKYYIDNFKSDTIKYSKLYELENITIGDFQNVKQGQFPYLQNCKVYSIDIQTLTPTSVLINKRGRYGDFIFTDNLDYLIYTERKCGDCDKKLWMLKLK